jgi:hypothetical protein
VVSLGKAIAFLLPSSVGPSPELKLGPTALAYGRRYIYYRCSLWRKRFSNGV